jgi:uncharacterized protein YbjT (DUF2867 family)
VPPGCEVTIGNALDAATFRDAVAPADTIVHLIGVSHPAPWKAAEFARVDLPSVAATVDAAIHAGVRHIVYVSVAQPAPIMRAYIDVRAACEARIRASGIAATFVRPWYVLGRGHWWPLVLTPLYAIASAVPSTRATAARLGLVRYAEMIAALCDAVAAPPLTATRIVEVPSIRLSDRSLSYRRADR